MWAFTPEEDAIGDRVAATLKNSADCATFETNATVTGYGVWLMVGMIVGGVILVSRALKKHLHVLHLQHTNF